MHKNGQMIVIKDATRKFLTLLKKFDVSASYKLAKELGVTQNAIYNLEKKGQISEVHLRKICENTDLFTYDQFVNLSADDFQKLLFPEEK